MIKYLIILLLLCFSNLILAETIIKKDNSIYIHSEVANRVNINGEQNISSIIIENDNTQQNNEKKNKQDNNSNWDKFFDTIFQNNQ